MSPQQDDLPRAVMFLQYRQALHRVIGCAERQKLASGPFHPCIAQVQVGDRDRLLLGKPGSAPRVEAKVRAKRKLACALARVSR